MSRETDNIEKLFSSRLSGAEMEVGDDFWESLNGDVVMARNRRRAIFYRIASCAAVLALLVTTSAAIWFLSPREEEMKQTFSQIESSAQAPVPFGDFALRSDSEENGAERLAQATGGRTFVSSVTDNDEEDDNDSVYISISFSISASGQPDEDEARSQRMADNLWRVGLNNSNSANYNYTDNGSGNASHTTDAAPRKWSGKVFVGSELPDGSSFKAPVSVGLSAERRLNKHLGVEAGLAYTMLRSGSAKQHDVSVPVKVNAHLDDTRKADFYATLGGLVEKCIAGDGATDKKVRAGVTAGVGVNYKLNNRLALYAEPTVTHHFVSKTNECNIRSQKPTNLNLAAGLRITY